MTIVYDFHRLVYGGCSPLSLLAAALFAIGFYGAVVKKNAIAV